MEDSTICEPLGRHHLGCLHKLRRQGSKHITREAGDAEEQIFSPE
jgi:hypothetical protein